MGPQLMQARLEDQRKEACFPIGDGLMNEGWRIGDEIGAGVLKCENI